MIQINCQLFKKTFEVKKVCKVSEMPKSAQFYFTAYFDKQSQEIYRTPNGVLYAKKPSF